MLGDSLLYFCKREDGNDVVEHDARSCILSGWVLDSRCIGSTSCFVTFLQAESEGI